MKKLLVLLMCCSSIILYAQILNGAWRLVKVNDLPIENETIKLYSNSYFTSATYNKNTGEFLAAKGGVYSLNSLSYKEHLEIDSKEPNHSGMTVEYIIRLKGNELEIQNLDTENHQKWVKIDDASNFEMAFSWRIYMKKHQGDDDWRTIEYAPRKTLKMLTDNRYQVLAFKSETGKFVGSSGGKWYSDGQSYTEHIEFFSKDHNNVDRSIQFRKTFEEGLWLHSGKTTKGEMMMEKWHRYK